MQKDSCLMFDPINYKSRTFQDIYLFTKN